MINNWNAIPGLEEADFIAAADISILSDGENRGYPRGIVVGIALPSPISWKLQIRMWITANSPGLRKRQNNWL